MTFSSRSPRRKLNRECYQQLHAGVLERDNWRCQVCGAMTHLEVHHVTFRSHGGDDSDENLVTLCTKCHSVFHGRH